MAVDSSWDNTGAAPPPRKGMPLWGKVLLGCGLVSVLFVGSCTALVFWGGRKAMQALDHSWDQASGLVRALQNDQGAREVYRSLPDLVKTYPTEEAFLEALSHHRESLASFPTRRPTFREMMRNRPSFQFHTSHQNGQEFLELRFQGSEGRLLTLEMEDGKLTDLSMEIRPY